MGTDGTFPSISDLGSEYKAVLRVDAPQQSLLDNLVNDFVTVDWYGGNTPQNPHEGCIEKCNPVLHHTDTSTVR